MIACCGTCTTSGVVCADTLWRVGQTSSRGKAWLALGVSTRAILAVASGLVGGREVTQQHR